VDGGGGWHKDEANISRENLLMLELNMHPAILKTQFSEAARLQLAKKMRIKQQ
jgi:hypothetical protein